MGKIFALELLALFQGIIVKGPEGQEVWYMPTIPALERWRQKYQECQSRELPSKALSLLNGEAYSQSSSD